MADTTHISETVSAGQLRAFIERIALENRHLTATRIAEIAGCSPQHAGRLIKAAGISVPKGIPGSGFGRKTGPKPSARPRGALSAETVRSDLSYDPRTGAFRWRSPRPKITVGALAGTQQSGYWMIHLRGVDYHAHRLAWLYVYGRWPEGDVDHINLDRFDNRIHNLREATRSQNCANTGIPSHNTSGFKGVSRIKRNGKWGARISCDGTPYHLGTFQTAGEAAAAYDRAAILLFGSFARTNAMILGGAA